MSARRRIGLTLAVATGGILAGALLGSARSGAEPTRAPSRGRAHATAVNAAPTPAVVPPAPAAAEDQDAAPAVVEEAARGAGTTFDVLKETVKEFVADHGQDSAAALTYYGVLAMFPAFIALVALLGVVGRESTVTTLVDIVQEIGSEQAAEAFRGPAQAAVDERGGAGALLGVGVLAAIWAASGYIGAFTRANNDIWEVEEDRPFWRLKPLQLLITLAVVLGAAALALALTLTGPVAFEIGSVIGLGSTAVWVWQFAKWPVMLIVFALIVALLYHATPNVRHRRFRWVSAGAGLAVLVWLVASAAFAAYVANLGSYGATYGGLGGVIVLILWLWITNIALLIGARLDARLERRARA